jgi:hypothetical protein
MKKSRFAEEQIATALRQMDAGAPIPEVTRALGISEANHRILHGFPRPNDIELHAMLMSPSVEPARSAHRDEMLPRTSRGR